jgi:hypothetical protein
MREKNIRVNEEELEMLKEYRDNNYPSVPLGAIIKILLEGEDE